MTLGFRRPTSERIPDPTAAMLKAADGTPSAAEHEHQAERTAAREMRRAVRRARSDQRRDLRRRAAVVRTSLPSSFLRYLPAVALLVLAGICGGLVLHIGVVSQLRHDRAQVLAYDQFRYDLAWATTTVAQYDYEQRLNEPGTPLALLEIPSLGLREVVLEATTSGVLRDGPGHRRDTVLPGQVGTSVVMGRQSTYGGPFGRIGDLRAGDQIVVTTGQGENIFQVLGTRRAGDPQPPPVPAGGARLTLVTADGVAYLPSGVLRVDADLISAVQPTPAKAIRAADLTDAEAVMAGDRTAWFGLVLWLQALLLGSAVVAWARQSWGRRQAWIVGVPLLAALGTATADQVALLLPNLL